MAHEAIPVSYSKVGVKGQNEEEEEEDFGFDLKFLRRFFRLHKVFMKKYSFSMGITILLILVALFQEFMIFKMGVLSSEFFQVLAAKNLDGFIRQCLYAIMVIAVVSFAMSSKAFVQNVLTVEWRKLICAHLHKLYLMDINYYTLNVLDKTIDNPDQRMTQDVDKFTDNYSEVLVKLIVCPITIIYYSYQTVKNTGWVGLLACFGYFLVSAIVNKFIMNPIVRYVVKQEEREGDFRFNHMMIRVHSEPIAFLNAAKIQGKKLDKSLHLLAYTQFKLYLRQYLLDTSVNMFIYLGSILSYLLMSIPIFSGSLDHLTAPQLSGVISKNVFVIFYLIYQFTSLIKTFGLFTQVAGVCHRIVQLLERIKGIDDEQENEDSKPEPKDLERIRRDSTNKNNGHSESNHLFFDELNQDELQLKKAITDLTPEQELQNEKNAQDKDKSSNTKVIIEPKKAFKLRKVTIRSPYDGQILVKELNMDICVGESMIIVGPSSAGKSSLLRVLRGLWDHGGSVTRLLSSGPSGAFFFTQKPFLTNGTLREQISFPSEVGKTNSTLTDAEITKYFHLVDLASLLSRVGGLDVNLPWTFYDNLSPGEVQRLCFIRVFLHKPVIAVLDEATSALPTDMEEIVYLECAKLNITCLSVAHRPTLKKFHKRQLRIVGNGSWELTDINTDNQNPNPNPNQNQHDVVRVRHFDQPILNSKMS